MLGIIAKNQKEMFAATRYNKRDDNEGEYFEFYFSEDLRSDDGQPIIGLITPTGYTRIRTSWDLDFECDQYIEFLFNGVMTMWRIDKVAYDPNVNRASVNRLAFNPTAEYVLTLNKVANPKAVIR